MPTTRPSRDQDIPAITAIYAHHVLNGTGTFETTPPTEQDMAARRADVLSKDLPYLVAEEDGRILGFAYCNWFKPRPAYRYSAEDSIYMADGERGPSPLTVTFLSGDVHFSYLAEVERPNGSRIVQAVCSPMRNPLPRFLRWFSVVMSYGAATPLGAAAALRSQTTVVGQFGNEAADIGMHSPRLFEKQTAVGRNGRLILQQVLEN